ncbi:MAG: hypothetical protein ACR2LQ_04990 [Acidimicrobiales bacterium]
MSEIRLGVRGRIIEGRWAGQTLLVEDATDATGGYLLIIGPDADGDAAGDMWVLEADLTAAFDEAEWTVEWEAQSP